MGNGGSIRRGWQAIGLLSLLSASGAEAATQGSMGASSTGSISISVSLPVRASISGLSDVVFDGPRGSTSARASQDLCVWSNSSARSYTVVATGSGSAGAFELSNGVRTVGYTVEWSSRAAPGSGDRVSSDAAMANLAAVATEADCKAGGATGNLIVALDRAQLEAVEPGAPYT